LATNQEIIDLLAQISEQASNRGGIVNINDSVAPCEGGVD